MNTLVKVMKVEWATIAKMAPSLKSGTGVMEEVLLHRLHTIAKKINLLVLKEAAAAEHMIVMVKR